jgi:inosose dehydratase
MVPAALDPAPTVDQTQKRFVMSTPAVERIAGAPISWGVCEVPGWGYQLTPSRVLTEMRDIGLAATEFGPDGFLPDSPEGKAQTLTEYGLHGVGGFTPVVLYRPDHDPAPEIDRVLDGFEAVGAKVLVLSADSGMVGYDARPDLDSAGWDTLLGNLDRLAARAAARGVTAVLHPHVGTMIEKGDEVQRVLENSSISLCLDTGHLLIGGTDPAVLTRQAPERIAHTHLKDVDAGLAKRVQAGELTYTEAVGKGMYRILGQGDVDIAGVITELEGKGYDGWYVLEQDTILHEAPAGAGPVDSVAASAD